ncbi:MAG TPA: chemotaxis protein CheW [Kofleriaceae bacterium]|nr:chemotaxis protein CheW [Kofleriaceae bacterium]
MGEPGSAALTGATAQSASAKLVCFLLHGQEYGAAIGDVVETLAVRAVTRVFLTPPWVAGIMNLRGDVVPVLDLALLLEMPPSLVTDESRIVLVRHQDLRAGLLVDGLAELRQVDADRLEAPPATLPPEVTGLLRGIATMADGAVVRVLDLPALFESDRVRTLDGLR